ncbi:MAG: type II toxin-antitoxin system HicB family antitoxin [Paludibacter sp.]|nr:type II toxin-antitoxin system HicB family antitoxin [Paludibacter sp.]
MKVTVIIEQNSKGRYSAYIANEEIKFGILGEGNTVEETIEDFKIGIEEMCETYQNAGREFPELELEFKYDMASFLSSFSNVMTLAGMSRLTGINQGLLSHYVTGRKHPRTTTVKKIRNSVREFGKALSQVDFV